MEAGNEECEVWLVEVEVLRGFLTHPCVGVEGWVQLGAAPCPDHVLPLLHQRSKLPFAVCSYIQKELLNNPRKYLAISRSTLKTPCFLPAAPQGEVAQHSCRQGEAGSCKPWGTSCTASCLCRARSQSVVLTLLGAPHTADARILSRCVRGPRWEELQGPAALCFKGTALGVCLCWRRPLGVTSRSCFGEQELSLPQPHSPGLGRGGGRAGGWMRGPCTPEVSSKPSANGKVVGGWWFSPRSLAVSCESPRYLIECILKWSGFVPAFLFC